jgi:hypothetical protein
MLIVYQGYVFLIHTIILLSLFYLNNFVVPIWISLYLELQQKSNVTITKWKLVWANLESSTYYEYLGGDVCQDFG